MSGAPIVNDPIDDPAAPRRAAPITRPLHFVPPAQRAAPDCSAHEPFALQVLGDDMRPEFEPGDIVIIEPGGAARDGAFVLARIDADWALRQLRRTADGWRLHTLGGADGGTPLAGFDSVRGVVIQRSKPGRRRLAKRYVE